MDDCNENVPFIVKIKKILHHVWTFLLIRGQDKTYEAQWWNCRGMEGGLRLSFSKVFIFDLIYFDRFILISILIYLLFLKTTTTTNHTFEITWVKKITTGLSVLILCSKLDSYNTDCVRLCFKEMMLRLCFLALKTMNFWRVSLKVKILKDFYFLAVKENFFDDPLCDLLTRLTVKTD